MVRSLILVSAFLLVAVGWSSTAQLPGGYAHVTGTVLDPNGNPYQNCTWTAQLVNQTNPPHTRLIITILPSVQ